MTENTTMTLDRYREVIALTLENTHACPPAVIADMMRKYEDVIRGSWSVGTVAVDVITLLYAAWKTFHSK